MTFDINTFKAAGLKYGGARPSLFIVEFAPPSGFLGSGGGGTTGGVAAAATNPTVAAAAAGAAAIGSQVGGTTSQALSRLTCKAAALPEATVAEIEVGYFGRRIKVAGERAFQDWQVTIINDENWVMRAMLEAWSNGINRLEANIRDPMFDVEGYKSDCVVRQYSKTGVEIRAYRMLGAWPSQVAAIGLDWDQGNAIEYFACTWAYDYWLPDTELGTDGAASYLNSTRDRNQAPAS